MLACDIYDKLTKGRYLLLSRLYARLLATADDRHCHSFLVRKRLIGPMRRDEELITIPQIRAYG